MELVVKKVKSEVAQLCPTLWDTMDYSLSGFSIHGIFQARGLEWVAISFSSGKEPPANSGDRREAGSYKLGYENPLEEGITNHGKPLPFLPGESPWTEEPGGLQSIGWQRVRHN